MTDFLANVVKYIFIPLAVIIGVLVLGLSCFHIFLRVIGKTTKEKLGKKQAKEIDQKTVESMTDESPVVLRFGERYRRAKT